MIGTKIILFLTAFGEFLINMGKQLGKEELRQEQNVKIKKDIKHANDIRAHASELSDELLIAPDKRSSINVLNLDSDLRGRASGGTSGSAIPGNTNKSS